MSKGVLVFSILRRSALFLLLLCLGCSAQSNSSANADHNLERLVRSHFTLPPSVNVEIVGRKPSPDFPQYDVVTVKLSKGSQSTTRDFLASKDGTKFFQLTPLEDPQKKIDLTNRPWRGNKNAKVTVVTYDDFECPFCSRNHQELMSNILKEYGDKIRIVYKDFPLTEIHPWAMHAAVDSNCLAAQNNDAYWDFADYVHANQHDITGAPPALDQKATPEQQKAAGQKALEGSFDRLDKIAMDIGKRRNLNTAKLDGCLKQQDQSQVAASRKEAEDLDLSATPIMFINGEKLDGAQPASEIKLAINRALRDAGEALPAQASAQQPAPNSNH